MGLTKATYSMISGAPVNILDFGAVGDGVTNDTDAFIAASAYIESIGGGKLVIPKGIYIVGKQSPLAGNFGKGYSYLGYDIISISNCTNPVIIEGNGAILKLQSGLHYGSFDPVTGAVYTTMPNYNPDYAASLGSFININTNASVIIRDLELDGNITDQTIGGGWGDVGTQLRAAGIWAYSNDNLVVENIYAHDHGLDGIAIGYPGLSTSTTQTYTNYLTNSKFTYNGRQGLSWVGGNHLTATNCIFSHTGKNGVVSSAPAAGVDIEPESSVCANGTFINCEFFDNAGSGLVNDNSTSAYNCSFFGCQFIGTTTWSLWAIGKDFKYTSCKIVGSSVHLGSSTTNSILNGCLLSMTATDSPTGVIYGSKMEFEFANATFETCTFTADASHALPYGNFSYLTYSNCTFTQSSTSDAYPRGSHLGRNVVTTNGTFQAGDVYGYLTINDVVQPINKPTYGYYNLLRNNLSDQINVRYISYSPDYSNYGAPPNTSPKQGDIVWSGNPSSGGYVGWVCITSASVVNATSLTSGENGNKYMIKEVGSTDFTAIGASSNTVGTWFTKSGGTGTGTGTVYTNGTWKTFGLIS